MKQTQQQSAVSSVDFAPYCKTGGDKLHMLASGSHDCNVRIWDTRDHLDFNLVSTFSHPGMVTLHREMEGEQKTCPRFSPAIMIAIMPPNKIPASPR
jgi:WD40 repeat protein